MKRKNELEIPPPRRRWTQPDAYLGAMARKRTFRRSRDDRRRTQPESPRALLSTVPFIVLIAFLALIAVSIMITAFPGSQPRPQPRQVAAHEQGVAERGWFQRAEREMHR